MSIATAALCVIAVPPVVGILWHSLTPSKVKHLARSAVSSFERSVDSLGSRSEAIKDSFTRPTL